MGQPLIINIKKNNKILVNTYYHWSAYTDEALKICDNLVSQLKEKSCDTIEDIVDLFKNVKDYSSKIIFTKIGFEKPILELNDDAIDSLKLSDNEKSLIKNLMKKYSFKYDVFPSVVTIYEHQYDRSEGLISVLEKDIKKSLLAGDFSIDIDINSKIVSFDVIRMYSAETFEESFGEKACSLEKTSMQVNPSCMSFDEYLDFSSEIQKSTYGLYNSKLDLVYSKIQ